MASVLDSYKEVKMSQPGLEVTCGPPAPAPVYEMLKSPTVQKQEPTILGVRRPTFFLSVALAIVIIAAVIGGGVGGSLAVQNAKSSCENTHGPAPVALTITNAAPSAAPSATATSTGGPLVVPTGVVKLDCPNITDDINIVLGTDVWVFTPVCGVDYTGSDFGGLVAYSLHDCLEACASHNHFSGKNECTAITFQANQTFYIPTNYGNCWLKSGNPAGNKVTGNGNMTVGAKLKTSNQGGN
ncbi:hypothetical protein F4861DRAFT_389588 [Xylaria intraflava]|nr:hypothetical protein F4861DRAFT_389588 [Xylaria intraflava]